MRPFRLNPIILLPSNDSNAIVIIGAGLRFVQPLFHILSLARCASTLAVLQLRAHYRDEY